MKNFLNEHKKILTMTVPVITVVLLCVLTGTLISMREKLNEMDNQIAYLIDTNSILQSQMLNLETNIELALEEEASFVEKYKIEVVDTDFSKGTYEVKISVVPKEYSDATKVSVFFGVQEIPLTLNRYGYEGTAKLSLSNNYDGNVAFLFANGDKRNTEVLKDYEGLQTQLKDLLYGFIPEIPKIKDGKMYFDDEVSYTLNAYGDYGYETLELILMADEEVIYSVDLLQGINEEVGKTKETGETREEGNIREEGSTREELLGEGQMVYGMSGIFALDGKFEVKEGQTIRLFLRAKCENGYRLEYDLFSGVIEEEGPNGFEETVDYFAPNYRVYDKEGNKYILK